MSLRSPAFAQKVVKNKKRYDRKKARQSDKQRLKDAKP